MAVQYVIMNQYEMPLVSMWYTFGALTDIKFGSSIHVEGEYMGIIVSPAEAEEFARYINCTYFSMPRRRQDRLCTLIRRVIYEAIQT